MIRDSEQTFDIYEMTGEKGHVSFTMVPSPVFGDIRRPDVRRALDR